MPNIDFRKLPGDTPNVGLNSDMLRISVGWRTKAGAAGAVAAPAGWMEGAIHAPVGAEGVHLLQAVAAAASHPDWTAKKGQEAQWAELDITLDVPPAWEVEYKCERLLIDGYRVVPTPDGWEEVLRFRCFRVTRTRNNQNPINLILDEHAD